MNEPKNNRISRKEFIRKSSAGILSVGLLGKASLLLSNSGKGFKPASPQTRFLGRTGIKVTIIGFGASRTQEPSLLKSALDTGINFIDTGRSYANGQNEVMVGKVIKNIRKDFIIQSKIRIPLREKGKELKTVEVSKKIKNLMLSSLNASLKALQTDYIDIMLIHGANSVEIINNEAVMEFFRTAKEKAQIRACGFSSHDNQVELLKAANESQFYDVIMVPYNYKGSYIHSNTGHFSEYDKDALESEFLKAEKNNIGIIAMKTCSGGPYSPNEKSEPSFKDGLKWILDHSYIHSATVAMGNISEIQENIQVMLNN